MADMRSQGPRKTRRWVLIADKLADRLIAVGGVLVIGAVLGMMVFLVYEVLLLFKGGSVESEASYKLDAAPGPILALAMDEHRTIAASVMDNGSVLAWHVGSGKKIEAPSFDFSGKKVTAFAKTIDNTYMAFGFDDGTVRFGKLIFETETMSAEQQPQGLEKLNELDSWAGQAIFSSIPGKQIRKVSLKVELEEPVKVADSDSPLVALDLRVSSFGERPRRILAAVSADGKPSLNIVESKLNMFTRKVTTSVSRTELPPVPAGAPIAYALVNNLADTVCLAEKTGKIYRYNTRDLDHPTLAETINVLPSGVDLTAFGYLLGDLSMVVGSSDGSISIYFLLPKEASGATDGFSLVNARQFEPQAAAVTSFSPSQRDKTFATADASGQIWIRHATSQKTLLKLKSADDKLSPKAIALAPRLDGLLAVRNDGRGAFWALSIEHPETSLHTLFGKVWYEGYPEPTYTWQSTGATEAFEPKLSLVPLIFGTLKATFYSLIFAIPIALLSAIYTSEFLAQRVRAAVKPVMEVMASLPSVILGFVAALVLAPIVETWLSAVLLTFGVAPLSLIFAAYLWQLMPPPLALRLEGVPKFSLMGAVVAGAFYVAYVLGPLFERFFLEAIFRRG